MNEMIYIMNVNWNWIKQRPHFIAEQLKKDYNIIVLNQYRYNKKGFQNRNTENYVVTFKVIPRIDRYFVLKWINLLLKKAVVKKIIKSKKPVILYLTSPEHIKWIPLNYAGKIIYDCMDDHYGLSRQKREKNRILNYELEICKRANYIIVSSNYLINLLVKRYGISITNKTFLVRNGYDGQILNIDKIKYKKNERLILAYFGTISDWFDFDIICQSLKEFSEIEYLLIGPLHRNIKIPNHPRIKYYGTVEHNELYEITKSADCFIMPFKLDEAIKAVDPVKLYEYINFYKNIICVQYDEIERFSNFVYFYVNYKQYRDIIKELINSNIVKYSNQARLKFLKENTCEVRTNHIKKIINRN